MARILLNEGAQHDFVTNNHRHSGYFGGRGAGKTFALVVRALIYAQQPTIPGEGPPVGCLLTDSFPHLKDIVYPVMYKVLRTAGIDFREVKNQSDRKFILWPQAKYANKPGHGAEILMRSLDQPDRVRGLTIAYFGIDEGREFADDYAYKVLLGAMRQGVHQDEDIDEQGIWIPGENYKQAGWVVSTPAGYDWQYRLFHPKSRTRLEDVGWYNAPTKQNKHLGSRFLRDLESSYEGLYYRQEVLGEFVGAVGGAVWPSFDPDVHVEGLDYEPNLPLYAGWDFGVGDAGVCLFSQIDWQEKKLYDGTIAKVPSLRLIDCIEEKDLSTGDWADRFHRYVDTHFKGRYPQAMWGDPAGMQRGHTATSTIRELNIRGVHVRPCPRRPVDEGIIIVQNLMERPGGFIVGSAHEGRIAQAVQTYRWRLDGEGNRVGNEPVHDWTSHICSALRYLAIGAIGLHPRRTLAPREEARRGTMGYILEQIVNAESDEVLMDNAEEAERRIDWHPDHPVGVRGLLGE